jgi:hypothetical protein
VFVVPLKMAAAYPRQRVENKEVFDLTIEDLRAKDCGAVPGIANKRKLQLSKVNIKNVGQLLDAYVKTTSFVQQAKTKFLAEFETMKEMRFLGEIEQFVIGVDYYSEKKELT